MDNFPSRSYQPRQSQYGAQARSTGPLPAAPPTDFQTIDDFEFYRVGTTSYRLSVNTIERNPYVSVSHWWFNTAQAAWFPSRKQIFLPKAAWFGLLEQADRASQVIQPIPEPSPPGLSDHQNCFLNHIFALLLLNAFHIRKTCFNFLLFVTRIISTILMI